MRRILLLALSSILAATFSSAEGRTTASVATESLDALGGRQAFKELGLLRMDVSENEDIPDGTKKSSKYTAYFETTMENSRLELPGDMIITSNGTVGWAIIKGNFDSRANSARMSAALNNQKLFPLLLPFTLDMDRIKYSMNAAEVTFEGEPSWKFAISFPKLFFPNPVISTIWEVYISKSDPTRVTARYLPVQEYVKVQAEGMQFQVKKWTEVNGVKLPAFVLVRGVDDKGQATDHTRKVTIDYQIVENPDPQLFVKPVDSKEGPAPR